MKTRTIQRSPNLGIGIRMQRLAAPTAPVVAVAAAPKPPYWWGWADAMGKEATTLEVLWRQYDNPAYFPGLWVAVVEGATAVTWQVQFTYVEWFADIEGNETEVVSPGPPHTLQLPPNGELPHPEELFAPNPLFVAAGNTLSVHIQQSPYVDPPSGKLFAQALVNGVNVGTVKLTLKHVHTPSYT